MGAESKCGGRWLLANPEGQLLREIADRSLARKSVAMTYRLAMEAEQAGGSEVDWPKVNRAILDR